MNKNSNFKNRQFHIEGRDTIIVALCLVAAIIFSFFFASYQTATDKFNIEKTNVDYVIQTPGVEQVSDIEALEHVDCVTPYYFASCNAEFSGKTIKAELYLVESAADFEYSLFPEALLISGTIPTKGDELCINEEFADKSGAKVGDIIRLVTGTGSVECKVSAIYKSDGRHDTGMLMALYAGKLEELLNANTELKYSGAYIKSNDTSATDAYLKSFAPTGDLRTREEFSSDELYEEYLELRSETDFTQTIFYRTRYIQELQNRYDGSMKKSIAFMVAVLVVELIAVAVFLSRRVIHYVETDMIKDIRNNFKEEQEKEMLVAYLTKISAISLICALAGSIGSSLLFIGRLKILAVVGSAAVVVIGGLIAGALSLKKAMNDFYTMVEEEKRRKQEP